jgi:hypothetical protein
MRSVVEKPEKAVEKTANGSTTVENVVSQYPAVQGTTSGGSSGSRVVQSYQPYQSQPVVNYQPVSGPVYYSTPVYSEPATTTWMNQPQSQQQQTCRRVWDRRTRSWVQVCN